MRLESRVPTHSDLLRTSSRNEWSTSLTRDYPHCLRIIHVALEIVAACVWPHWTVLFFIHEHSNHRYLKYKAGKQSERSSLFSRINQISGWRWSTFGRAAEVASRDMVNGFWTSSVKRRSPALDISDFQVKYLHCNLLLDSDSVCTSYSELGPKMTRWCVENGSAGDRWNLSTLLSPEIAQIEGMESIAKMRRSQGSLTVYIIYNLRLHSSGYMYHKVILSFLRFSFIFTILILTCLRTLTWCRSKLRYICFIIQFAGWSLQAGLLPSSISSLSCIGDGLLYRRLVHTYVSVSSRRIYFIFDHDFG